MCYGAANVEGISAGVIVIFQMADTEILESKK